MLWWALHGATKTGTRIALFSHIALLAWISFPFNHKVTAASWKEKAKGRVNSQLSQWLCQGDLCLCLIGQRLAIWPHLATRNLRVIVLWFHYHSLKFNGMNQEGWENDYKKVSAVSAAVWVVPDAAPPYRSYISLGQKQFVILYNFSSFGTGAWPWSHTVLFVCSLHHLLRAFRHHPGLVHFFFFLCPSHCWESAVYDFNISKNHSADTPSHHLPHKLPPPQSVPL